MFKVPLQDTVNIQINSIPVLPPVGVPSRVRVSGAWSSVWRCEEVVESLKVGLDGKSLGHWRQALRKVRMLLWDTSDLCESELHSEEQAQPLLLFDFLSFYVLSSCIHSCHCDAICHEVLTKAVVMPMPCP